MLPSVDPFVSTKTFFFTKGANRTNESQQISRSQKGGGYVYGASSIRKTTIEESTTSLPRTTFQPLVTRTQFTSSMLKRSEQGHRYSDTQFTITGNRESEIVTKDLNRMQYQGLSSIKDKGDIQTQAFFFNKALLRNHSSIHSEVSTDGGRSVLNNLWKQAQHQGCDEAAIVRNVEKQNSNYLKKITINSHQPKNLSRKIRQTFQKFKIHDPLQIKSQENVASQLRNQARIAKQQTIKTKSQRIFAKPNPRLVIDERLKKQQQEIIKLLQKEYNQEHNLPDEEEVEQPKQNPLPIINQEQICPMIRRQSNQLLIIKFPSRRRSISNMVRPEEDQDKEFDHVENNKKILTTKRDMIQKLHMLNRELSQQNIPRMLKETKFDRFELHTTYNLYTALQQITSQRYRFYNPDDGIDYDTFRHGIEQVSMQSEELARKIFAKIDFNYSGFLNWSEFLDLMVNIRAKTLKDKIDLFIKIADEDGNGQLSKDEIFNLSRICLSRYVKEDSPGGVEFLDLLCEYFTRLIFQSVEIDIEEEIPMAKIKEAILSGNSESDLLCMFCGADM